MMKTNSILIAALLIIGASVSTLANKPGDEYGLAAYPVKESETYKVIYEGQNTERVRLNVYNTKSEKIFSHSIITKGFIQPLSFQGLEAGEYTVEIVAGKTRETVKINHAPRLIPSSFVHITKLNDAGKYLVSVAKPKSVDENITLSIFQDNKLIYNESSKLADDFAKVYSVKPSGNNVTIAVTDKNGKVTSASF